jgi:hypothetical protein
MTGAERPAASAAGLASCWDRLHADVDELFLVYQIPEEEIVARVRAAIAEDAELLSALLARLAAERKLEG